MAGIVERLTEGVVNRDMRAEGHALLQKWERTGLLEGLKNDRQKGSMARLLENQAKELLRESSSMSAGDVEGFAAVAFPIVRRVFAGLIANDLVSVQPMSLPSGLIFFLDFVFSPSLGADNAQTNRMGNIVDKSIYGTNQVGSQITGGVSLCWCNPQGRPFGSSHCWCSWLCLCISNWFTDLFNQYLQLSCCLRLNWRNRSTEAQVSFGFISMILMYSLFRVLEPRLLLLSLKRLVTCLLPLTARSLTLITLVLSRLRSLPALVLQLETDPSVALPLRLVLAKLQT